MHRWILIADSVVRPPAVLLALVASLTGQQTQWTGAAGSSDWADPANWSSGVPTATADATVPVASPAPSTANTTAVCRSLNLAVGATMTIAPGFPLELAGTGPANSSIRGTIGGGGVLRITGSATLSGSAAGAIPNLEAAGSLLRLGFATTVRVTGDFSHTNGILDLPGRLSVGGNATFAARAPTGGGPLDVAGDVVFSATAAVTSPLARLEVAGDWDSTGATIAGPAATTVALDGTAPQTLDTGSLEFAALEVTNTAGITVNDGLVCRQRLVAAGSVDLGTVSADLDDTVQITGGVLSLNTGTHRFGGSVSFGGSGRIDSPPGSKLIFDAPGILRNPGSPIAELEITASCTLTGVRVSGPLDHIGGVLSIGSNNRIDGAATFAGTRVSDALSGDLDLNDTVRFATTQRIRSLPRISCSGDWTSNANFAPDPTSTPVVFDGAGSQSLTLGGGGFQWLIVAAGSVVIVTDPLVVRQNTDVRGVLDLSAASADLDGVIRADGGRIELGAATHTMGGDILFFNGGRIVASGGGGIVHDASGSIASNPGAPLPDIELRSDVTLRGMTFGGTVTQTGGTASIEGLVAVTGDALFRGTDVTNGFIGDLDLNADATFETSGVVDSPPGTIRCAGDWTSNANFDPLAGTVEFDGQVQQTVSAATLRMNILDIGPNSAITLAVDELFVRDNLVVDGSFVTARLVTEVGADLRVGSGGTLDATIGTVRVGGSLTNDGAILGSGPVTMTGNGSIGGSSSLPGIVVDATGTISVRGPAAVIRDDLRVQAGSLAVDDASLRVLGDGAFVGGSLRGNTSGILDLDADAVFDGATAGTAMPTIRCAGDWSSNSTFRPTNGEVVLDGADTTRLIALAPGFDPTFASLRFENGTRAFANDMTLDTPNWSLSNGSGGEVGPRRRIVLRCVGVTIDGRITIRAGGRLIGDSQTDIQVRSGGVMDLNGDPRTGNAGMGGSGWGLAIDGTLSASFFEFRGPGSAGVRIGPAATIARLADGVFAAPDAQAGSVLLDIARDAAQTFRDIDFVGPASAGVFNVRCPGPAGVTFIHWDGDFGGPTFEDDPGGRIDWVDQGRTDFGDFRAVGRIDRIELSFQTLREIHSTDFRIERALDPGGPFTEILGSPLTPIGSPTQGASYRLVDSAVSFPTRYHYRLLDDRNNAVRVVRPVASAEARPLPSRTGNSLFVGSGGNFGDIGAAIQAAAPGSSILIEPGSYPGFVVDRPVQIGVLGAGRAAVNGPVVVTGVRGGAIVLQGLDLASNALALEVTDCPDPVILDDLEHTAPVGVLGVRIRNCPRLAIQQCRLLGGSESLAVDRDSVVYVSRGAIDALDVRSRSAVTWAGLTPGIVRVDATSRVDARPGTAPRLEFPVGWPSSATIRLVVESDPGDLFGILIASGKGFTDLSALGFDMVLLLDQASLFTLETGLVGSGGSGLLDVIAPQDPAAWGTGLPVQAVVIRPTNGLVRFGNARDAILLP